MEGHLVGELEAAGVRTVCLSTVRSDRRWPQRLRRLLATERFDVVHAHSPVPATVARLAVRTLSRADRPALMTTEHNTWDSHRLPTRWANRLTGRHDRATLAVTAETLASLRGPAAPRAEVLVHGVDLVRIRASAPAARARVRAALGLGVGDLAIGTVANFRAQKDYPNLLGAPGCWSTVASPSASSPSGRDRWSGRSRRGGTSWASPSTCCWPASAPTPST